jgi:hypothetical protein
VCLHTAVFSPLVPPGSRSPLPLVNLFSLCFAPSGFLHKDLVGALLLVVSTPSSPSGSAPCLELARRHPEALDHSPITTSFQSHETHIRLGRRVERPSLCRLCSVHAAARCHIRCCAGTDSRRALLDLIHIRAVCDRNAAATPLGSLRTRAWHRCH